MGIATQSHGDLALLDVIDERLRDGPEAVSVFVDLRDYDSVEQLQGDFPGLGQSHQTPVAAVREDGSQKKAAWGKAARDLVAEVLGLVPDEVARRIGR